MDLNVITLAYLGDAIFEVYIRDKFIKSGIIKVDDLQKKVTNYVSAKGQAKIIDSLINDNILREDEVSIVKRGRNYKRSVHPKNTDIITYKKATGFEALIGYLYIENKLDRLKEILSRIEVD